MKAIQINGQEIPVREKEIKINDLDFWVENPRVYSALRVEGNEVPNQDEIFEKMKSLDNVKMLRAQIENDGGLIEPIYVRNNVVIEGNSRLAAYKLLLKKDLERWGKIKCFVLPDDLSDEMAFALIGKFHINGRAEWSPFEQAGFLYRHLHKSKKPIKALAKDLGLQPAKAQQFVDTYEMMMTHDDSEQSHWSYYFEMLKKKDISRVNKGTPELMLVDRLCDRIKTGKIDKANQLRSIQKLAEVGNEDALQALGDYLDDELSLEAAAAKVTDDERKKHANDVAVKFCEQLKDKNFIVDLIAQDEEFKFIMVKIISRLNKIYPDE